MRTNSVLSILLILLFISSPAFAVPKDYWQQEENYKIDITLQADLRTITGTCQTSEYEFRFSVAWLLGDRY